MLKFLGVLVIIVAILLGVGYYLGWYSVAVTDGKGNVNISFTLDKNKIEKDKHKAVNER